MNKRERLEKTLAGEATDRVPVALWRYWPGDDQRSADFAQSVIEFQQRYDWDFVRVTPDPTFCVTDYGLQSEWQGETSGRRSILKSPVKRSLEWTELRTLEPLRGELGKYVTAAQMICDGLKNVPIIPTIYSPLSQARMLGQDDLMLQHMRTHADRLHTGLNVITDSTLRLMDALKRLPVDGIFYVMDQASFGLMSEQEYTEFGLPYDRKIIETLPRQWWFNMLSLPASGAGSSGMMFNFAATYPVSAIHMADIDLDKAQAAFKGALNTGLSAQQHLHYGTPAIIRTIVRDAINYMHGRHLIVGAGDAFPVTTPLSNIRAVREAVEPVGVG